MFEEKLVETVYLLSFDVFKANGCISLIFFELSQISLASDVFLISFNCTENI